MGPDTRPRPSSRTGQATMTIPKSRVPDWTREDAAARPDDHERDLEQWRLLKEAVLLHRKALEEPDGIERARLLQKVIRLHSRWVQSQRAAD